MRRPLLGKVFALFVAGAIVSAALVRAQQTNQPEREAMYRRYLEFPSYVRGGSITPHWMADGSSFWYAEGAPANTVIYKVDPAANTKAPLFDTARLRRALAEALGHQPPYQGLPFADFTFLDGESAVRLTVESNQYLLQFGTYAVARLAGEPEREQPRSYPTSWGPFTLPEVVSPNSRWSAGVPDHNLWIRSTSENEAVQLTDGGLEDYEWGHDI